MGLNNQDQNDWIQRLGLSVLFGFIIVIASTISVLVMGSDKPSTWQAIASDVAGIPLLPGVGFVAMFFGAWQAVHQGQIALIPIVSLIVDSAIIFFGWQLLSRKHLKSKGTATLGLRRCLLMEIKKVAFSVVA